MDPDADRGTLLLEDALVLSLDDHIHTPAASSVCIEDGFIRAVGERAELRARFPDARRLRCRGRVILPGLVNAHVHPDLHILRGSLEQQGLHDWRQSGLFNTAVDQLGTAAGTTLQRASILACFAEAALSGTTCIGAYGVSDGALEASADALAALGLRGAVVARDDSFAGSPSVLSRGGFDYPVHYRLHAEETLTEAELERAAAAHRAGGRIVMHAAETRHRAALAQARFGDSTIRVLHRHGLLSPRVLLSHVTHIDADEIALIARTGTPVVFSAAAEMKLADGTPPALSLVRAGAPAGLGTDAAVCNNGTDMFVEMRAFGWQQKLHYGAAAFAPEQILRLATAGGADVLGLGGQTGRLKEGFAADLTLVDATSSRMLPRVTADGWHNVASSLVYSAVGPDVTDVMVAGRWIVRRRRLTMAPARTIRRDVDRAARTLLRQLTR